MLGNEITSYYWRIWVDFVGGLGLPVDKYVLAYSGLALVFYAIGYAFKVLVKR